MRWTPIRSSEGVRVTVTMGKGRLLIGVAAIVLMVLAYAWIDGGREPVHSISQSIPVPEIVK